MRTKRWPIFKSILTDFSLALIYSCCEVFNCMQITTLLNFLYENIYDNTVDISKVIHLDLLLLKLTSQLVYHKICSTHLFKAIIKRTKNSKLKSKERQLVLVSAAKLICCRNFFVFVEISNRLWQILNSPHKSTITESAKSFLEKVNCKSTMAKLPKKIDIKLVAKGNEIYINSPFFHHIKTFAFQKENDCHIAHNEFYDTDLSNYFFKGIMPYAPLWSSFFIERESNASVESYFRMIKRDILNYKLRQKPGRIIQRLHKYVDSKIFELQNAIPKKPAQRKDIINIPVETWKSKSDSPKIFSDEVVGNYF